MNSKIPLMDYRRKSMTMGLREYSPSSGSGGSISNDSYSSSSFNSLSSSGSPVLSRRRSVSPLYTPFNGSNTHLNSVIQRNKKEISFPQTEDEHLYLFHEKILWNQEKSLLPLAHDLTDWLNTTLGLGIIPSTLFESIENGVVLCRLAQLISQKAESSDAKIKPKLKGRVSPNAAKGSFFARDNVAMFISFCKELGVHTNLLFETEDLVSHGEIRSILICLMEVGRLAVKFGIEPPALVTLEYQIEKETALENIQSLLKSTYLQNDDSESETLKLTSSQSVQTNLTDSLDSGLPVDDDGVGDTENLDSMKQRKTALDLKVNEVAKISGKHCCCVEQTRENFKLRKLSEGKYLINGRTVFVRLLKGVHVMVRIGGGWETLEEFLVRNDPCRAKPNAGPRRRASCGVTAYGGYASNGHGAFSSNRSLSTCSTPVNSSTKKSFRPSSTPPASSSVIGNLRTLRARSAYSSACSTPIQRSSQHSSRNSLIT